MAGFAKSGAGVGSAIAALPAATAAHSAAAKVKAMNRMLILLVDLDAEADAVADRQDDRAKCWVRDERAIEFPDGARGLFVVGRRRGGRTVVPQEIIHDEDARRPHVRHHRVEIRRVLRL